MTTDTHDSTPDRRSATVKRIRPGFDVPFIPVTPPPADEAGHGPIAPGREVLPVGSRHSKKGRRLRHAIVVDRDAAVPMRDGTVLRADIYRSAAEQDAALPTVLAFTPYGKAGGYWNLDLFPGRAGVPRGRLSGLQSFESPDPDDWVGHGYAVVVADTRGAYHSDGDQHWWGLQAGEDGADLVEWIAQQPWSNGRVGMTGNSQLAMVQWAVAAERPAHLAAIAPWEGLADHYNDNLVVGGIPFPGFTDDVQSHAHGSGSIEDMTSMLPGHPFYDDYWKSKASPVERIEVPAYVVASVTNALHARGTLDAYRRLGSAQKWLRIHNTMEWSDYYDNVDDLRRFFDRYLKGEQNGWEQTAPVRYSVLELGGRDDVGREAATWPPERATHRLLHLDAAAGALVASTPDGAGTTDYDATDPDSIATFTHRFDADTEVVGYGSLRLWVSAADADDLDVFVELEKLDRRGRPRLGMIFDVPNPMRTMMPIAYARGLVKNVGFVFWRGPGGRLRASRRQLDPVASTASEPRLSNQSDAPVPRGVPVALDIPLWPASHRWRAGETMRLTVRGQDPRRGWFPEVPPVETINVGRHVVHTGPEFDSVLMLPVLPS